MKSILNNTSTLNENAKKKLHSHIFILHPLPQRNIYAQLCINTALNITIDLRAKILRDYIAVILTHSFLSLKNLLGIWLAEWDSLNKDCMRQGKVFFAKNSFAQIFLKGLVTSFWQSSRDVVHIMLPRLYRELTRAILLYF